MVMLYSEASLNGDPLIHTSCIAKITAEDHNAQPLVEIRFHELFCQGALNHDFHNLSTMVAMIIGLNLYV
jgi:hypothetical protein